jgi:hypothetical protein
MWPEPGSGFEASPFSPAGQMQLRWTFLRGLRRTRFGRPLLVLVAVVVVASVLLQVAQIVAWLV